MFLAIRKRISFANVAVTVALVFAMTGGAYAAKKYIITSPKQISPKVIKALKGKDGKAGAPGLPGAIGPAGPAGKDGANGVNGKDGSPGESVTSREVKTSEAACGKQGGSEFKVGSGTSTYACNGSPWVLNHLPKGATETGSWEDQNGKEANSLTSVSISFPVPLNEEPSPHYIEPTEVEKGELPEGCKGTPAKPEAEPGNLCVFADFPEEISQLESPQFFNPATYFANGELNGNLEGVSPYGTVLVFKTPSKIEGLGETAGRGTWAVTNNS